MSYIDIVTKYNAKIDKSIENCLDWETRAIKVAAQQDARYTGWFLNSHLDTLLARETAMLDSGIAPKCIKLHCTLDRDVKPEFKFEVLEVDEELLSKRAKVVFSRMCTHLDNTVYGTTFEKEFNKAGFTHAKIAKLYRDGEDLSDKAYFIFGFQVVSTLHD